MSEMIERVAIVLRDRYHDRTGSELPDGLQTDLAKWAIAAMRAPTDAMLHRISGSPDAREASWLATWHDMIDGALK